MVMNSTPNGSQEQGKKSGNEGFQEKGQAGSEALSFIVDSNDKEGERLVKNMLAIGMRLPEVSRYEN